MEQLFKVVKTPWPKSLPNNTIVKEAEPRNKDHRKGRWYTKADGSLLFDPKESNDPKDADGKFVLFNGEVTPFNQDNDATH